MTFHVYIIHAPLEHNSVNRVVHTSGRKKGNRAKVSENQLIKDISSSRAMLRREIEDEDFLTQCRHLMEKKDKGRTHWQGIPQGNQSPPAKIYLREADLWIERKIQERKMKEEIQICFGQEQR
ncbi:hypothetical protein RND71_018225 [Anisodus tanguticus]|uniref:Uncharacterized protein n=1 Tax=Anisodus tanguticus TaxID=243964 RepID=A0AAE1S2B1_9SOLA|nr:hypothetical protein RND71_018225 [Anisodus tanguticus]